MERTVFIRSKFAPVGETTFPNKKQSGNLWLGKSNIPHEDVKIETKIDYSDRVIDGENLAKEIETVSKALSSEGYRITSIIPITSGSYSIAPNLVSIEACYFGFSYTEGVIIHATKA